MKKFIRLLFTVVCLFVAHTVWADVDPKSYTRAVQILPERAPDLTLEDVTDLLSDKAKKVNDSTWTYSISKGDTVVTFTLIGKNGAEVKTVRSFEDLISDVSYIREGLTTLRLYGGTALYITTNKGYLQSIHFAGVAKHPTTGKANDGRNVNLKELKGLGYYGAYIWDDNCVFSKGLGNAKTRVKTARAVFTTLGNKHDKDGEYVTLYNSYDASNNRLAGVDSTSYEPEKFGINIWISDDEVSTQPSALIVKVTPDTATVKAGESPATTPDVIVTDSAGKTVDSKNYDIKYIVAGMKLSSSSTDPLTGTTVTANKWEVTAGEVPGSTLIHVVAVPKDPTAYSAAIGTYTLNSTTKAYIYLPWRDSLSIGKVGDDSLMVLYVTPNQWNDQSVKSTTTKIETAVRNARDKDITSLYTFSYKLDSDTYAKMTTTTGDTIQSVAVTPDDTYATLTITATNKETGDEVTRTVKIKVVKVSSDNKLKVQIFYPEGEDSVMVYTGDCFTFVKPTVIDEYGNNVVVTGYLVYSANTVSHKADSIGYVDIVGNKYYNARASYYGTGIAQVQTGGVGVDTLWVRAVIDQNIYEGASGKDVWGNSAYLTQDSVPLFVEVQLRVPELYFSPSEVVVHSGVTYESFSRIEVSARFYDRSDVNISTTTLGDYIKDDRTRVANGEITNSDESHTLVFGGNTSGGDGYSYLLYIPYSVAEKMTISGLTVKAYEVVNGDTVGTYYYSTKGFGNDDGWSITFNESGTYDLQYVVIPWNTTYWAIGTSSTASSSYITYIVKGIPTYSVTWESNKEELSYDGKIYTYDYNPEVNSQVTTTNYATNINMTFGGWQNKTYINNHKKEVKDSIYANKGKDRIGGWKELWDGKVTYDSVEIYDSAYYDTIYVKDADKHDTKEIDSIVYVTVSHNPKVYERITKYQYLADSLRYNAETDGFETFVVNSTSNPMDEKNQQYSHYIWKGGSAYEYAKDSTGQYYKTAFTLPCKGDFVKFEPKENGVVLVYLVQNGACDYTGSGTDSTKVQMKWRPLYIADESGKLIEALDSTSTKTLCDDYSLADSISSQLSYYTEGIYRCAMKSDKAAALTAKLENPQKESGCSYDWSKFTGTDEDKANLMKNWGENQVGSREDIIHLSDGGYTLISKARVRYAFPVTAGKTYFVFQSGSKPEWGGFSFVPEGWPAEDRSSYVKSKEWAAKYDATNNNKTQDSIMTELKGMTDTANVNVTITGHAFKTGYWTTLCVPFSISEAQFKEKFGKDATVLTVDSVGANGLIHFTQHAYRMVQAGRPYLIKPTKSGLEVTKESGNITFENVTIEPSINPDDFDVKLSNGFTFHGFYAPTRCPKNSYVMGNSSDFIYVKYTGTKDYWIPGYSAGFMIQDGTDATATMSANVAFASLLDSEDAGETTAIVTIYDKDGNSAKVSLGGLDNVIYTIDGRLAASQDINALPKGIYVRGGKKFVVK